MSTGSPSVTVIIVNYNGAHLLPQCLDALDAQREHDAPFDTIVVDNASVDDSLALLADHYPWVRVIASPTNLGFAGGNNLALRTLTTPLAALLNNDATPATGWLRNLIAPFHGPDAARIAIVTGKTVFMPRFVDLDLETSAFHPGRHDPRELGVRVYRLCVNGADVTEKALWESAAYGLELYGDTPFRWTRPAGNVLVPVPSAASGSVSLEQAVQITMTVAAHAPTVLKVNGADYDVGTVPGELTIDIPPGSPVRDVINNVGGVVFTDGYGADRGFQQVDTGQFDEAVDTFTGCGNGMAVRTEVGASVDWFDDDFFMYYEDTDLSWRIRSQGWRVCYAPDAVLRHIHSASSKAWSPSWVFHVDRNRLLMLTKNASAGLAVRAVGQYPLTTASMALRAAITALRVRQRPAVRPHLLRVRVLTSYLRLLPAMLAKRKRIRRAASVDRAALETWLVARS